MRPKTNPPRLRVHCRLAVQAPPEEEAKEAPPPAAKIGDLVELFMGRGQVRGIREEDGMLEVWAMGWEMAGEQRPRYFVSRDAVKVVPTVYYKMPGECCNLGALVRLCVSAIFGSRRGGEAQKGIYLLGYCAAASAR